MTKSLREAYLNVYVPEELTEEEILVNYFYSEGLDADDLDYLIEEYGDDFILEWANDVLEYQYELDEARKKGDFRKVEPTTKSGKSIRALKGGARAAAIKAIRSAKESGKSHPSLDLKQKRRESEAGPSPKTETNAEKLARLRKSRDERLASRKKESPSETKGKMKGVIGKALDRAKSDIKLVKDTAGTVHKTWKKGVDGLNTASDSRLARQARVATKKAAKTVGKAGESVGKKVGGHLGRAAAKSWVGDTFKAGQKLRRALSNSYEVEEVVEYLISEGYADDYNSAENMLNFMSEEWTEEILLDIDRQSDENL